MEIEKSKAKLGICIPTFNRDKYLKILLDSLEPQCVESGVYIYISDNCSDDNTTKLVNEFQEKYMNIVYHRNKENIGFYQNLIKVLKMAQTDYIWMMDDDDIIREGSIKKVLSILSSNPDFIVLNSSDCTRNMEIKEYKIIDCDRNILYIPGTHSELLLNLKKNSYFGIMVSMLIKKSIIVDNLEEMGLSQYEFFNNTYLPLILFFRSIVGKTGFFFCEPLILRRPNMRNSSISSFDWFLGGRLIALSALKKYGYDAKIIKKLIATSPSSAIFNAILVKDSDPTSVSFDNFIKNTKLIPLYEKTIYFILDKVPIKIVKIMREVLYKISGL